MRVRKLWLEWKVQLTIFYLVPPLIMALWVLDLVIVVKSPSAAASPRDMYLLYEVIWSMALAMVVSTVPPLEWDEGMLEMRLSYPATYWLSLLGKLALPVLMWAVAGALGGLALHRFYLAFDARELLAIALPPAVFMAGASLLASSVTLNSPLSMMICAAWWGWELILKGQKSGNLALMPYFNDGLYRIAVITNRWLLVGAGCALAALGALYLERRRLPAARE